MENISSGKILDGIKNNDRNIIQTIYDKYFSTISKYIKNNGGNDEDAWDVFQEGLIIIYEQIKNEKLEIKNTFITYFFTVCKYRWLKTLRDKGSKNFDHYDDTKELETIGFNTQDNQFEEVAEKERRLLLYHRNFKKISVECQKLIELLAKGLSTTEITQELNYKSTGFTYKKRRICKNMLVNKIKEDLATSQIKH